MIYKNLFLASTSGTLLSMLVWGLAWLGIGLLILISALKNPVGKRELKGYFQSPVAYVCVIIFVLVVMGLTFFFGGFIERAEANLSFSFFVFHPWVFMVISPAVGMRLWSEEKRLGTDELLFTFPVEDWKIVLSKFAASAFVIWFALFMTFPIVFTVNYLGDPENGVIFCGYLGSFLVGLTCLAITSATSAFTRSQIISLLVAVLICLGLVLAGFAPVATWIEGLGTLGVLFSWVPKISLLTHFEYFTRGVIYIGSLSFYLAFIAIGIFVTLLILRLRKF